MNKDFVEVPRLVEGQVGDIIVSNDMIEDISSHSNRNLMYTKREGES